MAAGRSNNSDDSAPVVELPAAASSGTQWTPDMHASVAMHQRAAARLLREGEPQRALTELIRSTRTVPMRASLASTVTRIAIAATDQHAALAFLSQGIDETDGADRVGVMRALIRLLRRGNHRERATELLTQVLAEVPDDRRARFVLDTLLEQDERWHELDASLEKETRLALRREAFGDASRLALRRARIGAERLQDPVRAGMRYGEAAVFAEQANDFENAFGLRMLQVRQLHRALTTGRLIDEAAAHLLALGEKIGSAERAHGLLRELALAHPQPLGLELARTPSGLRPSLQTQPTAETTIGPAPRRSPENPTDERGVLAVDREPDSVTTAKREAGYVARGEWRPLADFYRQLIERAQTKAEAASWAEKLAEVLESELDDRRAAADAWGLVAAATGDARAVSEQVRLHAERRDDQGVKLALDAAVAASQEPVDLVRALVLRGDEAHHRRRFDSARADYTRALSLIPNHLGASAGLAEVAAHLGDVGPIRALQQALAALPRRAPGRAASYRRLARLAESKLNDDVAAQQAWAQVAAEEPSDEEATDRLVSLARASNDDGALEEHLRAVLRQTPLGDRARPARMELVALLERTGRGDIAISVLREFVKLEPAHQAAWVALADRLISTGLADDAAAALEQAAGATEAPEERAALYLRLAKLLRETLYDDVRADLFDARAAGLRPLARRGAWPLGGPVLVPKARPQKNNPAATEDDSGEFKEVAEATESRAQPEEDAQLKVPLRHAARVVPVLKSISGLGDALSASDTDDEVFEVRTGDLSLPDSDHEDDDDTAVGDVEGRRATLEIPSATATLTGELPAVRPNFAQALAEERGALLEQVSAEPLVADHYRQLAEHFDTASDAARSSLMLEIGRALDGDPNAAPRTPKLVLLDSDQAVLRHPLLNSDAAQLLALVAPALCRLSPSRGRDAGSRDEFGFDVGKGAKAVGDALLAAVRILGLRAPDVHLSDEPGPPFSLVYVEGPRLLVGRQAVKKPTPNATLRFYAGRALFTLTPQLLALRCVARDDLVRGLLTVTQVLQGRATPAQSRLVVSDLNPDTWVRLKALLQTTFSALELGPLIEGARHSANRAGLLVAGGVAPAIEALHDKKALTSELIELVRFAASDEYLSLRSRGSR